MYIDRQIYLYGIQRDERYNYITIYYTKSIINDILKTILILVSYYISFTIYNSKKLVYMYSRGCSTVEY